MPHREMSEVMDDMVENNNDEIAAETGNSHDVKEHGEDVETEVTEKRWPGWPGESVFRILVPSHKVGGLIGRKGELIKKMCEESKSRIKILEGPPGVPERAVIISAKEEPGSPLPPAVDGLLRVHKRITEGLDTEPAHVLPTSGSMTTRLLVAATQAGSLIGKHGATIKSIQDASSSVVRIVETLPPVALPDDKVVEIQGDANGMHKAVELIATHLRKFLLDRSIIPLFEKRMDMVPHMQMEPHFPRQQPWGGPQGLAPNAAGSGFGNSQFMPPRPHDKYYPPSDFPPLDKQPHHGISMYGQNAPMGVHSAYQPASSIVSQGTHHMQVPLSYADAVIGAAGANISYIRRTSGATITIQETRGIPSEMTVEIIGTATQIQTAQQLIQNFMAEAAPAPAAQNSMGPGDQGYSSYPSYGPVNPVPAAHSGGYGSTYGTNYGY